MKKMPLQCGRMAFVAEEFCTLIDGEHGGDWIGRLGKVLPRLHVAVTALSAPSKEGSATLVYDDVKRCDRYLGLSDDLQCDRQLRGAYAKMSVGPRRRQQLCERMADNLADMYFDLKHGLALLPNNPQRASEVWQYSFYVHWGKHLLDAECWLRAVESGTEPVPLPEWQWPIASGMAVNPA
jgi:hypothetical protein